MRKVGKPILLGVGLSKNVKKVVRYNVFWRELKVN
jgi:hypothetical protein